VQWRFVVCWGTLQIPPLRFASVGMTRCVGVAFLCDCLGLKRFLDLLQY
jgi:hypothetical protein